MSFPAMRCKKSRAFDAAGREDPQILEWPRCSNFPHLIFLLWSIFAACSPRCPHVWDLAVTAEIMGGLMLGQLEILSCPASSASTWWRVKISWCSCVIRSSKLTDSHILQPSSDFEALTRHSLLKQMRRNCKVMMLMSVYSVHCTFCGDQSDQQHQIDIDKSKLLLKCFSQVICWHM